MPYVVGCDATPGHDNTCSSARMIAAISQKVQYPESMREQPTQGLVMLAIRISEKGEYDGVQATRFTNNDFAQAATSAARAAFKDMKFVPGKVAGKPVTVEVKLPVKFAAH